MREPARDRIHLRLSLLQLNVWPEAGDDYGVMFTSDCPLLVRPGHGRPHLREVRKPEAFRHHSGHEITLAVHINVLVHDGRIRSEMLLPQAMAEHHNIGASRLIFFRRKHTPQLRLNSHGREETGCRRAGIKLLRRRAAGQSEPVVGVHRHPFEDVVLPLPVEIIRRGNGECRHSRKARRRGSMPDPNQPVRISEPQRTQQNSIHHAENCRVSANAQGEGDHRNRSEPDALAKLAQRKVNVLQQSGHHSLPLIRSAMPPWDRFSSRAWQGRNTQPWPSRTAKAQRRQT